MPRRQKLKPGLLIFVLVTVAVTWWLEKQKHAVQPPDGQSQAPKEAPPAAPGHTEDAPDWDPDDTALRQAIRGKRSRVWVEGVGEIVRLLPEDREPPRHQLCLVELPFGHTIKISHNVDLAPKVPWRKGEQLAFRGRFEWNAKGGVVHWTHHDPQGRRRGGWLRHRGRLYE